MRCAGDAATSMPPPRAARRHAETFHVQCEYTNKLVCTCKHGAAKWANTQDELRFCYSASKLWNLYTKAMSSYAREGVTSSPCTMSSPRTTPLLFEGVACEVALPRLKPRFPNIESKRSHGWSFAEVRATLGDERTRDLYQAAFSNKALKSMTQSIGMNPLDDLDELGKQVGPGRITLQETRKMLEDKRRGIEALQGKAEKARRDADEFIAAVQEEQEQEAKLKEAGDQDTETTPEDGDALAGRSSSVLTLGQGREGGKAKLEPAVRTDAISRKPRTKHRKKRQRSLDDPYLADACKWLNEPIITSLPELPPPETAE